MKRLNGLFVILVFLVSGSATAQDGPKENLFKLGAVFGNVALSESPQGTSKNSIGLGGIFGYSLEDELSFELGYLQSSHDKVDLQDISLGVQYYFNSYEPFYYGFTAGVSFTTNELEISNTETLDDTAFGLFVGAGADVFTKRSMIIGLQARYYKMFASDITSNSTSYSVIDDYYTILVRLLFQF